jgi:perosamine synthetase
MYHVYQSYVVGLHPAIDRNAVIFSMKKDDIQCQIGTYASHIQPVYRTNDQCPNSKFLFDHSLALPLYYEMTDQDVAVVAEKLLEHMQVQRKGAING